MDIPVNPITRHTFAGEESCLQTEFLTLYKEYYTQNSDDGAVANAVDIEGNTALVLAIMQGCDIDAIRCWLEKGADVNKANCAGRSPLCIALQHADCSPELVHLILKAGASENSCRMHNDLLHCYSANAKQIVPGVLKLLLVKLIGMERFHNEALCLALNSVGCRADVVKALLEMGCHANNCMMHNSSLNCYFDETLKQAAMEDYDLNEEVISLLLDTVTSEMRERHYFFESPLCIVLNHPKCTPKIVKLLLQSRALFRRCYYHETDYHCFTESTSGFHAVNSLNADFTKAFLDGGAWRERCSQHGSMLTCYVRYGNITADVIKLFLDKGMNAHEVSLNGDTPLHSVLRYSDYEIAAINLLMDFPGFDVNKTGENNSSFMHCALQNSNIKRDVLQLLLNRGAKTDTVDSRGNTTLHIAVKNRYCDTDIMKMLLDDGCPVFTNNEQEVTPLEMVLTGEYRRPRFDKAKFRRVDVVRLLLTAGAPMNVKHYGVDRSLLELALSLVPIDVSQENILECQQTMLEYALLVTPCMEINELIVCHFCSHDERYGLLPYVNLCMNEIRNMYMQYVVSDLTLRQIAAGLRKEVIYDFDILLKILASNKFPIYFSIISTRVKREIMEDKLRKLNAYVMSDLPWKGNRKIVLDCDSLSHIGQFLSDKDLLSYLVAYYVPTVH